MKIKHGEEKKYLEQMAMNEDYARESIAIGERLMKNFIYCPIVMAIKARLPHYDEVNSSMELLMLHLTHEDMENRASLNVAQKEINKLLPTSIREEDIVISGI